MINLENNLNFYKSYFHGIQDIAKFESKSQAALGALKILSGFTVVIPIIFGIGVLVSQHRLESLRNLCDRVSQSLPDDNAGELTQEDLITFLSTRVLDHNKDDKDDFESAFKKLTTKSQDVFFTSMANQAHLKTALEYTPHDVEKICIGIGSASPEEIKQSIDQLEGFTQLHEVTFDLSQTTYLSKRIRERIKKRVNFGDSGMGSMPNDMALVGGFYRTNNAKPAAAVIDGVFNSLIRQNKTVAMVEFKFDETFGSEVPSYIVNYHRLQQSSRDKFEYNSLNKRTFTKEMPDKWDTAVT